MTPYIDYYKKHKIIPTIDLDDISIKNMFQQRESFYFLLSIQKNAFKNSSILELCPGNGYNAYYLLTALNPSKITLVDNNEYSIRGLKKNLKKFKDKKIIYSDIYKFNTNKKYNFVIIENTLPGLDNPKKIFNKSISFLEKEGTLITTLSDDFSLFSEKLRFLMSHIIINSDDIKDLNRDKKIDILSNIFQSHLRTLNTDTRNAKKWVQDNMLHYEWMTKKNYFSIDDIYEIFLKKKNFSIIRTSPDFNTNYQWYKKYDRLRYMQNLYKNYTENKINFIDRKDKFNSKNTKENGQVLKKIYNQIKSINMLINLLEENLLFPDGKIKKIVNKLKFLNVQLNLLDSSDHLYISINEFIIFLEKFIDKKEIDLKILKKFKSFWGNGTMQISIIKHY